MEERKIEEIKIEEEKPCYTVPKYDVVSPVENADAFYTYTYTYVNY